MFCYLLVAFFEIFNLKYLERKRTKNLAFHNVPVFLITEFGARLKRPNVQIRVVYFIQS